MSPTIHNLIIVGSGPAGYTAALYAARAQLQPLVFEGSITAGGALMGTTEVENYPGFPEGIMGPDLMSNMRLQATKFGAQLVTDDITNINTHHPIKAVRDSAGTLHYARSLILAMGSGHRQLGLPDEQRLSGHGISWCATCDGFFSRNCDIAVVGGGDSALEEALFLTRFANKVTVIHRRDQLRASRILAQRAHSHPKIEFAWNSEIIEIHGEDKLSGVTLRDTVDGSTRHQPLSTLFIAISHDPRSELVRGQVDTDEDGYVQVEHPTTRTGVDGVFACGDLVDRHYRQAITAAGSAAAAALDAERYLANLVSQSLDFPNVASELVTNGSHERESVFHTL